MDYHSFRAESLGLAKEFFTKMLNNQNFSRPTSFYRGTSVGRQTEDRETRIFNASLTTAASDADFARFTDVIAAFAENPENYKYEGYIMRQMITSNYLNIPSVLSNEDLGKLFDFETGSPYLRIRFSNGVDYGGLFHADGEYGWDLFEDPFKIAALDEMARGGYADFREEIILSDSFRDSRGECIYQYMKIVSSWLYSSTIKNFENNDNTDLIITTYDNINDPASGRTDGSKIEVGIVTIKINSARITPNAVDWAAALFHEGLHAEMYRFVEANEPGISPGDRARIMQLLLFYKGSTWGNNTAVQHIRISEKYVVPIAEALRELDHNQYPVDYYMGFAWAGLLGDTPENLKPTQSQLADWAAKENIVRQNHTFPCPD